MLRLARRVGPLTATVAIAMAAPAAGSGTAGAAGCGPASARTLVADAQARVYVVGKLVYACDGATGKQYTLGQANSCTQAAQAGPVALAGATVAYGLSECATKTNISAVVVRSLASGKQLHRFAAMSPPYSGYGQVSSIVVSASGAAAWIAVDTSHFHRKSVHPHPRVGFVKKTTEVHDGAKLLASGTTSSRAGLVSGVRIDPRSLRLSRTRLSWRQNGRTRTATLR